jgi:hypothetical protein
VTFILLGSHRRRFPADYIKPTVARHVLKKAACPVLVVRTDPPASGGHPPGSEAHKQKRQKRAA